MSMQGNDSIRSDFEVLMEEKSLSLERDMFGDYHASYVHAAFQGFEAACRNPPKCVRDRIIREFLESQKVNAEVSYDLTGVIGYGIPGNVVYKDEKRMCSLNPVTRHPQRPENPPSTDIHEGNGIP